MTLPDWSSQINAQIDAILAWAPLGVLVVVIVGSAAAFYVARMFLRTFH